MLDHLGLRTTNVPDTVAFYEAALVPLGASKLFDLGEHGAGFGREGRPTFWIGPGQAPSQVHVAFSAPDRETVDAFYEAALKAGATSNGAPGLRPQYHPRYYGAFVIDPDGNNIEAVCHRG